MIPAQVAQPVVIAQFSDLHVTAPGMRNGDGIDTAEGLSRSIGHLAALDRAPDLLVLSGDLVDEGSVPEYQRLREMLSRVHIPVYLMPGNHDRRIPMRTIFADHDYLHAADRMFYHRDVRGLRLIMLDSLIEGRESGDLDELQLAWLGSLLQAEPAQPVLVLLHHPPVVTGFSRMDRISLSADSVARLCELLSGHPQVLAISCGHLHRNVRAVCRGVPVSVCPSTAFQARLHLGRGRFEAAPDEPPGYQLHYWDGQNLVTHTVTV